MEEMYYRQMVWDLMRPFIKAEFEKQKKNKGRLLHWYEINAILNEFLGTRYPTDPDWTNCILEG